MSRMVLCACGHVIKLGEEQLGRAVSCPRCGRMVEHAKPGASPDRPAITAPARPRTPPFQPIRPVVLPSQPNAANAPGPPRPYPATTRPAATPFAAPAYAPTPSLTAVSSHPALRRIPWPLLGAVCGGSLLGGLIIFLVTRPGKPPAEDLSLKLPPPPSVQPVSDGPRSTREIVSKNEASVAKVQGKFGSGTGFLAAPGIVATNEHVLNGELVANVTVRFPSAAGPDQGPFPVRLLYVNPARDLALMKIESRLPPIDVARPYTFQRGEDITIIGNPGGLGGAVSLENAITRGVLSTEATFRGQRWYQLGASVNPGNSGGPVLDSRGKVIGIITLKALKEEGHSYCIPVDALTGALDEVSDITPSQRLQVERRHNTRSIFVVLEKSAGFYFEASARLVAMAKAKSDKDNIPDELKENYKECKANAAAYHNRTRQDYSSALESVLGESSTDPSVRHDIEALRRLLDRLKSMSDDPQGTIAEFETGLMEAGRERKRLTERLSSTLDVSL